MPNNNIFLTETHNIFLTETHKPWIYLRTIEKLIFSQITVIKQEVVSSVLQVPCFCSHYLSVSSSSFLIASNVTGLTHVLSSQLKFKPLHSHAAVHGCQC